MESNGDKLVANRVKKRGMSWTVAGAQRLAVAIQLSANAELSDWCWQHHRQRTTAKRARPPRRLLPAKNYQGQWLQVTLPALTGPHTSRPWAQPFVPWLILLTDLTDTGSSVAWKLTHYRQPG
jgi:hypothetical protein